MLKKEQQLIKDFTCLKYNEFNLETFEKGSKIMNDMQKYNVICSYTIWKDLIEMYLLSQQEITCNFELFVINSFLSFFNITDLDFVFHMVLSLELSSQYVITYFFISQDFDLNFVSAVICKLINEKKFEVEKDVILRIKEYSKRLIKDVFDFDVFLEEVCRMHLKNGKIHDLDEKEISVIDLIAKLYKNKKRLSMIIYN